MPARLNTVSLPSEDVRQQFSSVKAYLEDDYLGQGVLCVAESQLLWTLVGQESGQQGVAIDYPSLTMHGIVTHDPKYPEEHLVVIVQQTKDSDDEDESNANQQENDEGNESPVEYDAIHTVNYRFVMNGSEDLKIAYQIIAECQALHPDPLDDMVEDDEVGSDIDYGEEEETNGNGNGNGDNDDPYGYDAHFASMNQGTRGSRFGRNRRGQQDDQGNNESHDHTEEMD